MRDNLIEREVSDTHELQGCQSSPLCWESDGLGDEKGACTPCCRLQQSQGGDVNTNMRRYPCYLLDKTRGPT
jgi:hypothetical protein